MQQPLTKRYRKAILPSSNFKSPQQTTSSNKTSPSSYQPTPNINPLINNICQQTAVIAQNDAFISRFSAHLAVVFLVGCAIFLAQTSLPQVQLNVLQPVEFNPSYEPARANLKAPVTQEKNYPPLDKPTQLNTPNKGIFFRKAVPLAAMPELPRQEISQYTIQAGDTVYGIAYQFGLNPETVLWSNPQLEENPHWLQVGASVNILPFDGIYHQVGGSDTIDSIASAYKVESTAIIDSPLNELDPLNPIIIAGQWLVVPDGSKPFVPPQVQSIVNYASVAPTGAPVGSGIMGWPITGRISQGYFGYHPAIDIESPIGSPVLAIDSGFVAAAGWDNSGYGYHVVIDHGNGLQSMYAHLQSYYLEAGDFVEKGQAVGEVGMSGRSSGPHLHLEIRQGTIQLNPLSYLP